MIITGIGSRETPLRILREMENIGKWCLKNNITIRSGHADGADWAFERGSQEKCVVYLPWVGFNKHLVSRAQQFVVPDDNQYNEVTKIFHPNFSALSVGAKKLMNRNSCQVLGLDLDELCDYIICWTKDGSDSGGTGQAIRIGREFNVPVFNMYLEQFNSCDKIKALV